MNVKLRKYKAELADRNGWVIGWPYPDHNSTKWYIRTGNPNKIVCYMIRPSTLSQYIGIQDSNGVIIFENDELVDDDGNIYVVKWVNDIGQYVVFTQNNEYHGQVACLKDLTLRDTSRIYTI